MEMRNQEFIFYSTSELFNPMAKWNTAVPCPTSRIRKCCSGRDIENFLYIHCEDYPLFSYTDIIYHSSSQSKTQGNLQRLNRWSLI